MSIDGECFFICKDDFPYELLIRHLDSGIKL